MVDNNKRADPLKPCTVNQSFASHNSEQITHVVCKISSLKLLNIFISLL